MYTHNLDKKNGGVTFALKTRAEVLASEKFDTHIITHGFSVNEQLQPKGYNVTNVYDYYSQCRGQPLGEEQIFFQDEILYKDKNKPNSFRVFSNGEYKQYRQCKSNGELIAIDCFNVPWNRTKKYLFKDGHLVKIFYMDNSNKPKLAKYVKDYNCYITSVVDSNSWQDKVIYNHINKEENTLYNFKFNFVKEYIEKNNIDIVFIDKREDVEFFLKIQNIIPTLKLIFVLHSNHYEDYKL